MLNWSYFKSESNFFNKKFPERAPGHTLQRIHVAGIIFDDEPDRHIARYSACVQPEEAPGGILPSADLIRSKKRQNPDVFYSLPPGKTFCRSDPSLPGNAAHGKTGICIRREESPMHWHASC